ncbi:MAG: class I SAM-dependent methyltransferase [Acidimicrobiales bacterium]
MPTSLHRTLQRIADVEGWMTDDQAGRLWGAAATVAPTGQIVEIGSFRGRSTIVLATAAAPGVKVVAIDPHAGNDRGPQEFEGFAVEAETDHEAFHANLERCDVHDRVRHIRAFSEAAHPDVDGEIDVLYIDGAHRFGPARHDIVSWGDRVRTGGVMLIHDSFSSVGVTLAILTTLVPGRRFRYHGRSGSLTEYKAVTELPLTARAYNAAHQLASLPWFVRNVIIKALILARLGRLTRLLGHRQATWPY